MLKIKDDIDLKELEKFGFEKYSDEEGYYFDFIPYMKNIQSSYIEIGYNREISCLDYVEIEHHQIAVEKLFDLIQAGLVEKDKSE